ncbi:hypothetical protein [Streptomyces sp. NPDC051909]|uniref:hypothetical protein n=1 Tax=Streptomyces sp. NPDC051909 TaxID=3154944 RepID=UPI00342BE6DD
MRYEHSHLPGPGDYDDTLEEWMVSVVQRGDGDEDGPTVGELTLFRLRDYTGFSRIEAADGYSAELLSIAETVLDGSDYSDAFMEAIESPVGDLLILDRVYSPSRCAASGLGRSSRPRRSAAWRAGAARWPANRG